jgi:hypothetical protein
MFDMFNMMGKIKEMQAKMKEAQDNLSRIELTAEAGAGMVKATVNGNRQVIKLDIDESLFTPADKEVLQDLTAAAVNKALLEMDIRIKDELQQATQGVMPNIPGLNLEDLMKGG